jgi:hypothetical protein
VDVIDLKENTFKTLPVNEVISPRYPPLRYLVQVDEDGYSQFHPVVHQWDSAQSDGPDL